MANNTLKISVPEEESDFLTISEAVTHFGEGNQSMGEAVVLEIINRYCSTQRLARKYRTNKAAKDKAILAKAKELGITA